MGTCKNCGGKVHYGGRKAISGEEIWQHNYDDKIKCQNPEVK